LLLASHMLQYMIHSLRTFLSRNVNDLSSFLAPLKKAICFKDHLHLLLKLCLHPPNDSEQVMLALPTCLGDLGIFDPQKIAINFQFQSLPLWLLPSYFFFWLCKFPLSTWSQARGTFHQASKTYWQPFCLVFYLPPNLQLSLKLDGEKGASFWLSTLPLECHLPLWFCDAVAFHYGWSPSNCFCGKSNIIEHALSCNCPMELSQPCDTTT